MLAGRTDAGDLGILIGLRAHRVGRIRDSLSPQMRRVPELRGAILDPEIDGVRRLAL